MKGPRAAVHYVRSLRTGHTRAAIGHNPLGGWMVVAMLVMLLLQVATGLVSDDEILTQGPLSTLASTSLVSRANTIHEWNQYAIAGAVALHVLAIAFYRWGLKVDLVGPMVHGGALPAGAQSVHRATAWAVVTFAAASAIVYAIVVLVPRLA